MCLRERETNLVWRPGDGLDGCSVFRVGLHRSRRRQIPHQELVVVASRRQQLVIWGPLQPTHLLGVAVESPSGGVASAAPVVPLEDAVVTTTGSDDVIIPGDRTCTHATVGI